MRKLIISIFIFCFIFGCSSIPKNTDHQAYLKTETYDQFAQRLKSFNDCKKLANVQKTSRMEKLIYIDLCMVKKGYTSYVDLTERTHRRGDGE